MMKIHAVCICPWRHKLLFHLQSLWRQRVYHCANLSLHKSRQYLLISLCSSSEFWSSACINLSITVCFADIQFLNGLILRKSIFHFTNDPEILWGIWEKLDSLLVRLETGIHIPVVFKSGHATTFYVSSNFRCKLLLCHFIIAMMLSYQDIY